MKALAGTGRRASIRPWVRDVEDYRLERVVGGDLGVQEGVAKLDALLPERGRVHAQVSIPFFEF